MRMDCGELRYPLLLLGAPKLPLLGRCCVGFELNLCQLPPFDPEEKAERFCCCAGAVLVLGSPKRPQFPRLVELFVDPGWLKPAPPVAGWPNRRHDPCELCELAPTLPCPNPDRLTCPDCRLLKNCVLFEVREKDAGLTLLFESCMLDRLGVKGSWPRSTLACCRLPV